MSPEERAAAGVGAPGEQELSSVAPDVDQAQGNPVVEEFAQRLAAGEVPADQVRHYHAEAQRQDPNLRFGDFIKASHARADQIRPLEPGAPQAELGDEPDRAEEIMEEAARLVNSPDVAGTESRLHELHNQLLAETGDPSYSYDSFVSSAVDRATQLATAPAAEVVSPPVAPSAAEVSVMREPATLTEPEPAAPASEPASVSTGPAFTPRPGQTYNNFSDLRREGSVDPSASTSREARPESEVKKSARPGGRKRVSSAPSPAGQPKDNETELQIPQPLAEIKTSDGRSRQISPERRAQAEAKYRELYPQIQVKWSQLEEKYKGRSRIDRENAIMADPELQPMLQEFTRAKQELAVPVRPSRPATERPATPKPELTSPAEPRLAPEKPLDVPQPVTGQRHRQGSGWVKSATPAERAAAADAYRDLQKQIDTKWAELEEKYKGLPAKKREDRIRGDRTMQPLLRDFVRVKEMLVAPVQDRGAAPVESGRSVSPTGTFRSPEAARPRGNVIPDGIFDDRELTAPDGGVLQPDEDLLRGLDTPKARRGAGPVRPETPLTPAAPTAERTVQNPVPARREKLPRPTRQAQQPAAVASSIRPTTDQTDAAILDRLGDQAKREEKERTSRLLGEPAGKPGSVDEEDRMLDLIDRQSSRAVETDTTPHTPLARVEARPETAVEDREAEPTAAELALKDARDAYAKALMHERRWFSFGNKKEVNKTARQYDQAKEAALREAVRDIRDAFPNGDEGLNEVEKAERAARCLEACLTFSKAEQVKFRDTMNDPSRQNLVEKFRLAWRKGWKQRLGIGVGVGLLGPAFGMNMLMSGVTWANNIEAAARGIGKMAGKKWGASQDFASKEDIEHMDRAEIERRLAAHTFDVLEHGEIQAARAAGKKKGKKGEAAPAAPVESKELAKTRDLLHERHSELIRAEREQDVEARLRAGESLTDVMEHTIKTSLSSGDDLHDAYLNRIHRNKNMAKIRIVGSAAGGALVGMVVHEAMQHVAQSEAVQHGKKAVGEWFKGFFDQADTVPATRPGGALGTAYRDLDASGPPPSSPDQGPPVKKDWADLRMQDDAEMSPKSWADHRMQESGYDAARQPTQAAAIEAAQVRTLETAKAGDSVWDMAERYVDRVNPGLNAEQRTWVVDSMKDAISKSPETFGLSDPNQIEVGQTVDFSQAGIDLKDLVGKAGRLSTESLASIKENNAAIEAWQSAHPGETLTDETVDSIVRGTASTVESAGDAGSAVVPTARPPMSDFYVTDAQGHEQFRMPDAPSTPEVLQTNVAEQPLSQKIPEGLTLTPELVNEYSHYQTIAIDLPEHSLAQLGQSLKTISLERAQEVGQVEAAVEALDASQAQRQLLTTSLHSVARSLLKAGHPAHESVAAGLEWLRVSR